MQQLIGRRLFSALLAPVFLLCASWTAVGLWGGDGHKIVAQVAYDNLTANAKNEVDRLLDGDTLATFSVWPDQVKHTPNYSWSAPYHFADMDEDEDQFTFVQDCPEGKCVVQAILDYSTTLSAADTSKDQKVEALKFLTHYVGDIHQPLHIGHKGDKGGNGINVSFFGSNKNLHSVWDEGLLKRKGKTWTQYAADLESKIKPADKTTWLSVTDPAAWATESHRLAEDHAYRQPAGAVIQNGDVLGQDYYNDNIVIVDEQLTKAGLRLAQMLNTIFDPSAPPPPPPPAATGPTGPTGPTGSVPTPPAGTDPQVKFVGSRKSDVYHYPGCRDVENIKPENLVEYSSAPPGKHLHSGCPR
jgi:hypothetical protein